jgi:hypothetical protein
MSHFDIIFCCAFTEVGPVCKSGTPTPPEYGIYGLKTKADQNLNQNFVRTPQVQLPHPTSPTPSPHKSNPNRPIKGCIFYNNIMK